MSIDVYGRHSFTRAKKLSCLLSFFNELTSIYKGQCAINGKV